MKPSSSSEATRNGSVVRGRVPDLRRDEVVRDRVAQFGHRGIVGDSAGHDAGRGRDWGRGARDAVRLRRRWCRRRRLRDRRAARRRRSRLRPAPRGRTRPARRDVPGAPGRLAAPQAAGLGLRLGAGRRWRAEEASSGPARRRNVVVHAVRRPRLAGGLRRVGGAREPGLGVRRRAAVFPASRDRRRLRRPAVARQPRTHPGQPLPGPRDDRGARRGDHGVRWPPGSRGSRITTSRARSASGTCR